MDDNDSGGLPAEVQHEIRTSAHAAIVEHLDGAPMHLANPSDAQLVEMMSISLGERVPASYATMIRNVPAAEIDTEIDQATNQADCQPWLLGLGMGLSQPRSSLEPVASAIRAARVAGSPRAPSMTRRSVDIAVRSALCSAQCRS